MKRTSAAVLLGAVAIAAAGCAGSQQRAAAGVRRESPPVRRGPAGPLWARRCLPTGSQLLGPAPRYVGLTYRAASRLDRHGSDLVYAGGGGRCSTFDDDVFRTRPIAFVYSTRLIRAPGGRIVAAVRAAPGWQPSDRQGLVGPVLGGQVQVVAYTRTDVRICPDYGIATVLGPARVPPCAHGLRALGVDTSALTNHVEGHRARWGFLYLVGDYRDGVFSVASQRLHGPASRPAGSSSLATPPCLTPKGGWRLVTPTQSQRSTVERYSNLAHHHDLVSIAFFDHGSVLTAASSHPARTRAVLGRYWPRQLCVVRARYSRATLIAVGKRLERLLQSPRSAAYGWITGAGGTGVSDSGQPTTSVQVLLETPPLRALLGRLPRGLVVVEAALHPVGRD